MSRQMPWFRDDYRDQMEDRADYHEPDDHDAIEWAQTAEDGEQLGAYVMRDGQLWNQGRYLGEDGDNRPFPVQTQWQPDLPAEDEGRAR